MAKKQKKSKAAKGAPPPKVKAAGGFCRILGAIAMRAAQAAAGLAIAIAVLTVLFAFVNPPATPMIIGEYIRTGSVDREWTAIDRIPAHVPNSIVAAEDANFCRHWGFDLGALRSSARAGLTEAGSTISQKTASHLFLWRGDSWIRKVLEVPLTLLIEAIWSKRRVLEVYMNIAQFDEGVFGVSEAARKHFGKELAALDENESARLAIVLPDPKGRNPFDLTPELEQRVLSIQGGAGIILADGSSSCLDA